jgi:hypothetical protein
MKTRDQVTIGLLVGTAVAWILWDIVLGAGGDKTESMWIAEWVRAANSLAFFLGALVAHWTLQTLRPHYAWWPVAVGILLAVVGWDIACASGAISPPEWSRYPGLWLLLGLPVGHWAWPQRWPRVVR